jgi:hypothetical protein
MLSFDEKTQKVQAHDESGRPVWEGELVAEDDRGLHVFRSAARSGGCRGRAGSWAIRLEFAAPGEGFDALRLFVAPQDKRLLRRVFLRVPGGRDAVPALDTSRTRMFSLPNEVFVEKGVVKLGRGRGPVTSSFVTVLSSGKRNLLAGVGDMSEDFSCIRVDGEALEAGFEPQRALKKEETYCLIVATGRNPLDLLDVYGRYLSRFGRTRAEPVAGWNSWDYYGASVTMDDLRKEMAAINGSPLKRKLTHFVVDMGWWTDWGDFQPNRRFPAQPREIAKEIAEAGFVPGIWHAPLQCSPWSYLGRHRQDLFVRAEQGGPETSNGNAILDWTKPEVLQIVHDWFAGLRKAGFRYFKLDYIYTDAVRQMTRRADDTIGLAAVIRNGLKTIREAVGEDSYILNCGAARESSVGITDASRISTDIHTFWSHIWHNSREVACHLWEHRNLWNIDPDFALVRCPETTDDPFPNYIYTRRPWSDRNHFWMAGPEASFEELKVWLTVVHMTGGDVVLSDSIARLNSKGIDALGKLFPRMTSAARPLDMFVNPLPRFWLARSGKMTRLAVFNWEDRETPIVVPRGIDVPATGVDVWTGRRVAVAEKTAMAPRSAYLLEV